MAIGKLMTLGLGAGLMYWFDPGQGRRRRAVLRDQGIRLGHLERELIGKGARDLSNRALGLAGRVRHPTPKNVSDEVLADRVRARLGRAVTHPGALEVRASSGHVVLLGPILATERERLIRAVAGVPGVVDVIDRLEPHASADVPALQGDGPRRRGRRVAWSPALRAAAIATGGGLVVAGLLGRRDVRGAIAALGGGALLVRGIIDRPLGSSVTVRKAITVDVPVELVFALLSNVENFPRFMEHVSRVTVSDGGRRSHWKVDGPGVFPIAFDAELTGLVPDRMVSWKTLPGQPVEHEGVIQFEPVAGGGTRVLVEMRYHPPGGVIGHAVARVFGWDPRARMNEDLVRMKGLLEAGHTRAHGARVEVADVLPPPQ
jgi:uncharacterized membrane protein